jgi:hypothetical protein
MLRRKCTLRQFSEWESKARNLVDIIYLLVCAHAHECTVKEQCHETLVEIRPWSDRLSLNLWSRTLFLLKNGPSQSYVPYSSASIDVKTGSPDPADFAMTQLLIYWRVLAIHAMVERPLAYRSHHSVICQLHGS